MTPKFLNKFQEKHLRAGEALRDTKEWQVFSTLDEVADLLGLAVDRYDDALVRPNWHALAMAVQSSGIQHTRGNLVAAILFAAGSPMTTVEILEALDGLGHSVSGKSAANILAATLARDRRFANAVGPDHKRRWKLSNDLISSEREFRVKN